MTRRILLADDSVTIQKVVELTFMDDDYRVTAVSTGDEAVARLDPAPSGQGEELPDLVIADVHMPGLNGYQVCRRVKAARPGTPVLLLVGTFEPFSKEELAACGADGVLKKPFDSQELLRQVEELLRVAPGAAAADAAPAAAAAPAADLAPEAVWGNLDDALSGAVPGIAPQTRGVAPPAAASANEAPTADLEPAAPELEATSPELPRLRAAIASAAATDTARAPALSDQDVDRIARRVVEILSEKIVREVSWEVIPDLAEVIIKDRLRELESQVE
jgi:CheY-like chemotaxis protein